MYYKNFLNLYLYSIMIAWLTSYKWLWARCNAGYLKNGKRAACNHGVMGGREVAKYEISVMHLSIETPTPIRPPPPSAPPPDSQSCTQGTQGSLCTITHVCRNIMATTVSVRFVLVSCFIYRSEEAKSCDKWRWRWYWTVSLDWGQRWWNFFQYDKG